MITHEELEILQKKKKKNTIKAYISTGKARMSAVLDRMGKNKVSS